MGENSGKTGKSQRGERNLKPGISPREEPTVKESLIAATRFHRQEQGKRQRSKGKASSAAKGSAELFGSELNYSAVLSQCRQMNRRGWRRGELCGSSLSLTSVAEFQSAPAGGLACAKHLGVR